MTGGGTPSLEEAYRVHAHAVFRRARKILGNAHEAEEIVQDLFESLADDGAPLRQAISLTAWFYTATTNRCLNRIRDDRNRVRLLLARTEPSSKATPSADDTLTLRQLLARVPDELAT